MQLVQGMLDSTVLVCLKPHAESYQGPLPPNRRQKDLPVDRVLEASSHQKDGVP